MDNRQIRVIHWGSGNTGSRALKQVLAHPGLQLVGWYVHDLNKVGLDAGEFCDQPACGVNASNDLDALLALGADCLLYMATEWGRTPEQVYDDICHILKSGKNVVTTTFVPLIYPPALGPDVVARLEQACAEGGVSFYATGIEPGFTADALVLTLSSLCERIDHIRVHEHMDVAAYAEPVQAEGYGFGLTPEQDRARYIPGGMAFYWGSVIHMVADGLGIVLDDVREERHTVITPEDIVLPWTTIRAGTIAAIYFEVSGVSAGANKITVAHSYVLDPEVGAHWAPPMLPGRGSMRNTQIKVSGDPDIHLELCLDSGSHPLAGVVATAARAVNAIAPVCAAKPGVCTFFDLPPITAHGRVS